MTNNPTHLQIATRIQLLIEQWLGESFNVDHMLRDPAEAREVLFVCQASNNPELIRLARQFTALGRPMPVLTSVVPAGAVPTAARRASPDRQAARERAGWLSRPKWLRREPPASLRS